MLDMNKVFSFLQSKNIPHDKIMHLGANLAQSRNLYISGGAKRILWVEAIPMIVDYLKNTIPESSQEVILQAVLSDTSGENVLFNIADNKGMSSSIFEFDKHSNMYPNIKITNTIELSTTTLDDLLFLNNILYDQHNFMILDLQGAELKTFLGSPKTLQNINAICVEVSQINLYKNAPLENEIHDFLTKLNFEKSMVEYTEYGWGEALYVRK